jgi:hypothetical protein
MAKAPIKRKPQVATGDSSAASPARSARGLLVAAVILSAASLGGGFFLARLAFQMDAEEFEPDYVEGTEVGAEDQSSVEFADDNADIAENSEGPEALEGVLEFSDIITDIRSYNAQNESVRSFLKLSVILVYLPEPGARELMEERQPFMHDLFTTFARSLTESEIRGAAGLMVIKSELLKRARAATGNNLPQDVLIRDIIVQ